MTKPYAMVTYWYTDYGPCPLPSEPVIDELGRLLEWVRNQRPRYFDGIAMARLWDSLRDEITARLTVYAQPHADKFIAEQREKHKP